MVGDADVRVHSGEKGKKLLDADVTDAKRMAAGNADAAQCRAEINSPFFIF